MFGGMRFWSMAQDALGGLALGTCITHPSSGSPSATEMTTLLDLKRNTEAQDSHSGRERHRGTLPRAGPSPRRKSRHPHWVRLQHAWGQACGAAPEMWVWVRGPHCLGASPWLGTWPSREVLEGRNPAGCVCVLTHAAAAAKLLQSCPTLCDPIDGSPPGSPVPGILQARTLEWVAISFSKAWKWKVKVKSLSHVRLLATPWTAAYQAPPSMGFSRQKYWSGVLK